MDQFNVMTKKLTYKYAFTLLKMKNAEGRNEYMDLAKEANLLWHQIVRQNLNTHLESTVGHNLFITLSLIKRKQDFSQQNYSLLIQLIV